MCDLCIYNFIIIFNTFIIVKKAYKNAKIDNVFVHFSFVPTDHLVVKVQFNYF